MKNLESNICSHIRKAIVSIGKVANEQLSEISLQATKVEFEGDFTLVCFQFTRLLGKNPEQIGNEIGGYLFENCSDIENFNVVKGFLNLSVKDSSWKKEFLDFGDSEIWKGLPGKSERILIEYSSPNTNKPLHLGHLRNNFLGYSLSELLKFAGYDVVKANLVNDRGIHICKSMVAYMESGMTETPESSGMKGDHFVGKYYVQFDQILKSQVAELVKNGVSEDLAKEKAPVSIKAKKMLLDWESGDKEVLGLWKTMNGWVYKGFEATYKRMGVDFDKFYYESDTYILGKDVVDEGLASGVFFKKEDGSVWIDLTNEGLDQKLVLRSDGTSVYITQDIGTAELKFKEFKMDRSVYVVGNEQDYHFVVLFHILRKLGRSYAKGLHHLSYGMVDLPSGKMKSREGTVVDADELMDEMVNTAKERTSELGKIADFEANELNELYEVLGLGAIKYFLLKVDPKKRMMFNPQESIELNGNTATAIQYTHARISAISRKAIQQGLELKLTAIPDSLEKSEKDLLKHLLKFESIVLEASKEYSPAVIANYLYETSRLYNSFFAHESIFQASTPEKVQFRVALSVKSGEVIRACGKILGIVMPERM
jgi:arginyl-tRNA synthetase